MIWEHLCRCDLYLARQSILRAVNSDYVKSLVIEILKVLVKHSDNEVDDFIVEQLETAIYNNKQKLS